MKPWYPRGKLNQADEGAALIKIFAKDNTVVIDFGKDIKWIGMDKNSAIQMGNAIIEQANKIKEH